MRLLAVGLSTLLLAALAATSSPDGARGASASGDDSAVVELRVWQDVLYPQSLLVSARPEGGDWGALGTIPLPQGGKSDDGSLRYGDITVGGVELRVWQGVGDPMSVSVSARRTGGEWLDPGPLQLDDGHSSDGRFRYGNMRIVVPLDELPPLVAVSPGGTEVPRLAVATIAFRVPPSEADGAALVSIAPPVEGSFVWADNRTLLYQPAYPGWQRGKRYELRVDAAAAGLSEDHVHAFTVSGGLEVAYIIPGDGDREVPAEAQILVQFNRSVAALTVLQEGDAPPVLEFDPQIAGKGEWLNTSLYRFTPSKGLPPSTQYRVRIPAGLTSAADGVLQSDFEWSFATIQPAITRFKPSDGSKFVEPDGPFVVTFNQPMDRASVEAGLKLRDAVRLAATAVSFTWSEGDTVVRLTPAEPLALGVAYELVAAAGLRGASGGSSSSERVAGFTVVDVPRLVRTSPADGATDASWHGTALYYNNPMDPDSFDGLVSISTIDQEDIEVRWYPWSPERVSVRAPLKPSTRYTVRISEGARDRGGRTVPVATEFSFTTRTPTVRESLSLAVPASFVTFSAGDQQAVYYHAQNLEEAHFRLYRLSDSEAEILLRRGFIDGWSSSQGRTINFWPESEPIRTWTEPIDAELRGASRLYSTSLSVGEPLPEGHYILAADEGDDEYWRKLVLSVVDTAIVTKLAFDELIVWALDYDSGTPLSGVTVNTAPLEDPPSSAYQSAATDSDGLARFTVTAARDSYWSPYGNHLVRVEEHGRSGVASTRWGAGADPWRLGAFWYFPIPVGHLYSDRPIYRPGETVHFKAVVRDDDDASLAVPGPGTEVTVRIRDTRGENLLDTMSELDEFGALAGEFVLPGNAATGRYEVSVLDGHGRFVTRASFTVAEFRAPEFEVTAEAAGTDYLAADAIPTEVAASFYLGGAVADAAVKWSAWAWPTSIRVEGYEDYSFSEYDYYYQTPDRADPLRGDGETRTDASGSARFEVPARLEQDEGTQQFTISATVTDANGQAVGNSTAVTVHPATWYAGIKTESYIARAGEPETIHLVTVDFERRIAPNRPVKVRVVEREWVRSKERADHGGYSYRYELRETEIEVLAATTNEAGEASLTFTPPKSGSYRLVAESLDERERVARSARFLWVSGSDHAPWPVRDDDIIELIADREEYEVGDVAEVLVPAPFAGATALVTIERGRVLSSEVRSFETNSEVLRIPIEDAHIPNIYVGVVLYRPPTADDPYPRYIVGNIELSVSTAPRSLDVRIEPDRTQALAGETVRYDVTVTDAEGRGVESDLAVAIVDKAVLALADELGADGMSAFWYERRLGVRTASSLAALVDRWNEAYREAGEGEEGSSQSLDAPSAPENPDTGMSGAEDAVIAPAPVAESGADAPVRSDFQNTALWIGQLATDEAGEASFELHLPDNTTTWRALARAVTAETQLGEGESELRVTQPLLVRPALPRFLRVGDSVTLRTLVRNDTNAAREVTVTIEFQGVVLDDDAARTITIEPGDSAIFEWPARVLAEGTATVRFRAVADSYGDAVEVSLPVHLDVTPETTATGGVVEDVPAIEAVYLPDYVITGSGSLELSLQGSLVGALDEELDYFKPYLRWTEWPVRIASRVIASVAVERATPDGLDQTERAQLTADVRKLLGEQEHHGWWSWCGVCEQDAWVSGWVLLALGEARDTAETVPDGALSWATRAVTEYLDRTTDVERPADANQHAFLLYALVDASNEGREVSARSREQAGRVLAIFEQHRADLTNWGRAYLLLSLIGCGHERDHQAVRALLSDLTANTIASANGNHWEDERIAGSMHNGSVRTTAIVLRALTEVDPSHPLIEETARWLAYARSVNRWKTDVERAQGMASLGAYAELTGETRGVYDYSVLVNATRVLDGDFDVPAGDYLDAAAVALADLPPGEVSRVQFDREAASAGRLYYGLNLRYVTPAQAVEALNRGFAVSRRYSLLDDPGTPITSASIGDVVRVVVTVAAPADRLFARVEDSLPAGLEPIDPQLNIVAPYLRERLEADRAEAQLGAAPAYSAPWYRWYWTPWDQVDLRDDRVVLLANRLPRGVHEYVYYARATTPGDYFVAPARAEESYFPDVFGRGDSSRFTVIAAEVERTAVRSRDRPETPTPTSTPTSTPTPTAECDPPDEVIQQRLAALRAQQAIDRQALVDQQADALQALRDEGDSAEDIAALQQSQQQALTTFNVNANSISSLHPSSAARDH